MTINEIKHPDLKMQINMIYMHSENKDEKNIKKSEKIIKDYLNKNEFIISVENNKHTTIPYGNNGEYVIPIFTDKLEYERGMEYFRLNEMDENRSYEIKKLKNEDNPNFLGFLINIASSSYITLL